MVSNRSLMLGSMDMLVLELLAEKDMYGYEIIASLKSRSNNVFDMKSGTLYPILHSLVQNGCLISYDKEVLARTRIYYKITEKGRKALHAKTKEWESFSSAVNNILLQGD